MQIKKVNENGDVDIFLDDEEKADIREIFDLAEQTCNLSLINHYVIAYFKAKQLNVSKTGFFENLRIALNLEEDLENEDKPE